MIDVEEKYLKQVKDILNKFAPGCEVRVYGSRVNGKAEKYSDIDLTIIDKGNINDKTLSDIKEALAESNLPMMVDVSLWSTINGKFKAIIQKKYVII